MELKSCAAFGYCGGLGISFKFGNYVAVNGYRNGYFLIPQRTLAVQRNLYGKLSVSKRNRVRMAKTSSEEDDLSESDSSSVATTFFDAGEMEKSELQSEMSRSYLEYAMSVILGRALPDIRDGLKPVHRRILFGMDELNLNPKGPFHKCARVVGHVLGRLHPHGDTAVYDALVRLAQPFSSAAPLIDGHGNFGSVDGDPAAAMRYTECRLTPLTKQALLSDLEFNTVDMIANFDNSQTEPLVLPSKAPILLLNGASGIAVGMATNVPPHNLGELIRATIAMIKNPEIADLELMEMVPGPDFPTGGSIMGVTGIREMYTTGRGSIPMRAKTHFEKVKVKKIERSAIIVTELPFQTQKAALVARIAELVNSKVVEGIADLRDESDRSGMRIVIELKRDETPEVVLNNLLKKSGLQSTFSANLLALDAKRKPDRFTLRSYLKSFIDFRRETVYRRSKFQKEKAEQSLHLATGYAIAQRNISAVVQLIRDSDDTASARSGLCGKFDLSYDQAEAILAMPLRRLTSMEAKKIDDEIGTIQEHIKRLETLLTVPDELNAVIIQELVAVEKLGAVPRRTEILVDDGGIDEMSLVENNESVVLITQQGFIKRLPVEEFSTQRRNSMGKAGISRLKEDDVVEHFAYCRDRDCILILSNAGIAYGIRAYKIAQVSRTARGIPLSRLIPGVPPGESVASLLPVSEFRDDEFIMLLTQQGYVKRTAISSFAKISTRGLRIITLAPNDHLKWVRRCSDADAIVMGSRFGNAYRARMLSIPPHGRTSRGKRTMTLQEGDDIIDMDVVPVRELDEMYLVVILESGRGKRVKASLVPMRKSLRSKGVAAIPKKSLALGDAVVGIRVCHPDDQIMLLTSSGIINRQSLSSIPAQSRQARGVSVQKLSPGDSVTRMTIIRAGEQTSGDLEQL